MVTMLLLIFKIILFIVLSILVLLILVLSLVLFVPISYEASGEKYDKIILNGQITWLLKGLRMDFNYKEELKFSVKVLWKTILSSAKPEPKTKKRKSKHKKKLKSKKSKSTKLEKVETKKEVTKEENSKVQSNSREVMTEKMNTTLPQKQKNENSVVVPLSNSKDFEAETKIADKKVIDEKVIDKNKQGKTKLKENQEKSKEKNQEKKANQFKPILDKIVAFFKDGAYHGVIRFVLKNSWKIIKAILPRKYRLNLKFGTQDPALTGYILGLISIFYAITGNAMVVEPDFEEQIIEGRFSVKGRIFLFVIAFYALKIILDKRVKKIISEFNN